MNRIKECISERKKTGIPFFQSCEMNKKDKAVPFGIRKKIIAATTYEGWREAPHVSYVYEADVTDFYHEFLKLKALGGQKGNISFNTLLLRVIVEGIKAAPQMNAEIHFNPFLVSGRVTVKKEININMPVLLPAGEMVTVNLRDFGNKSLAAMSKQISGITEKIKRTDIETSLLRVGVKDTMKKLKRGKIIKSIGRGIGAVTGKEKNKQTDSKAYVLKEKLLDQGTITVSNLGAAIKGTRGRIGILDIIPPQVSVVGIGVLQEQPGVFQTEEGVSQIGIRRILPLTIVFDHRALDFGEVAPFVNCMERIFRNPKVIHGW